VAQKRKTEPAKSIVYGSLYMDQGESYEYAETQIDACIAAKPVPPQEMLFLFDIIATPAQMASGLARQWGQHILDYCDQHYPTLFTRLVGITDDDQRRLLRDSMITGTLSEEDIDEVHLIEME
jgi:hypothetical protein